MIKYEYDETMKILYKSTKKVPFFVNVPKMNYITYNGVGHPGGEDFQEACNSLFTLSYLLKFKIVRPKTDINYKVNPLEVSWFLDKKETGIDFTWKAMIMQPGFIGESDFDEALVLSKQLGKQLRYDKVQFESLEFGRCVQCFHLGDYNQMNDTMHKMQDYAKTNHLGYNLYTHDIYLNDSRKTKTDNLKTIMRIGVHNNE